MKVYFSANHRNIKQDKAIYDLIVNTIREEGHILVNNWIEAAWFTDMAADSEKRDWVAICNEAAVGIEDADVVIAEASGLSGFGVGYEAARAVSGGKPTLILLEGKRESVSYAVGLRDPLIRVEGYEIASVSKRVRESLRKESGV